MKTGGEKLSFYVKVLKECKEFCEEQNFSFFLLTETTQAEEYFSHKKYLISDIPASLFDMLGDAKFLNAFPPLNRETGNTGFYYWEHLETGFENDVHDTLEDLGLTHALGVPLITVNGSGTALFFGGTELADKTNVPQLLNWANSLSNRLWNELDKKSQLPVRISKRERECLLWTSQGKTSYEIGMILGLSENTINNYLATVGRKMGAFNRPHMVGLALRNGFIE